MSPNRTNPKSLVEEKKEIYPNLNIFHNKSIRLWIKKCPNLGPCCDDQIFELHNRQLLSSHSSVWLTSFGAKSRVFWVSVIPPSHWENYISICFQIEWDMIVMTIFLSILNQSKGKLSPQPQCEMKWKYIFFSVSILHYHETSYDLFPTYKVHHLVQSGIVIEKDVTSHGMSKWIC